MAAEDEPPSLAQVETVRAGTRDRIGGEGEDRFDPRDVAKLMADEGFVARFWIHAFFIPGDRVENAVNLVIDTFKWRKDFGVNDITEADLDMEILERGSLYYHNRDKKGSRLLVFCIRKHNKDSKKMETMKKMLIYLLERLDKEEAGKRITIIFDSEGAGLSNFDLEQVKFLIHVLISYYPNFVEKILVFEMPWILNTAWKIIKSLLPPPAVARIKFVTKSNIKELISPDQLPVSWGGEDDWEFEAGLFLSRGPGPGQGVLELEEDGQGYRLSPARVVTFRGRTAELAVSCTGPRHLAVKVRTTNPGLFHVSPHTASLGPGQQVTIRIRTSGSGDTVTNQQFQLSFLQTEEQQSPAQLARLFSARGAGHRRVVLGCEVEAAPSPAPAAANITAALRERVASLEDKIHNLYQILALQAILVIAILVYKSFSY